MNNSSNISNAATNQNPHEEALQSLCKQLLKSRLFRGYYTERRYVESVSGYRDIVKLERSERDLEKLLLYVKEKLHLCYQNSPDVWIGITNGTVSGDPMQLNLLETCIWAELDDYAFGQYWFLIRSIRFRDKEIIVKLKVMRPADEEGVHRRSSTGGRAMERLKGGEAIPEPTDTAIKPLITIDDFVQLVQTWGNDVKYAVYDFMSNDLNKDNIKSLIRFLGMVLISVMAGALVAIKYLGVFTLRFMFEFSRLTHVMTPIILKIIEVVNKIIGGFYILLAMIWRDTVGNREQTQRRIPALQYKPSRKQIPS